MRDELNLMELVDRYLSGDLNASDRTAFEERMRSNAELRELVEDQRALHGGMERLALRPAVHKAYRSYKLGKWAPGIGGAAVIAILAVGGWMLAKESGPLHSSTDTAVENGQQQLAVLPDTAGTNLPALVMHIDPKADTTLITPNGLVLDIPKGAFVDEAGNAITTPVRVTLLEAINGVDIMKAGLSTMAGDTLLETGGMFYLDAQVDGKRVGIDPTKPLTVMVPSDHADPRMMLYEGVMTDEGIVDWRNPQPLSRTLVPVDISTLDLYPPGYLDKLAELGKDAGDKGYTDSLYWTFGAEYARSANRKEATWDSYSSKAYSFIERTVGARSSFVDGAFLFASHCASCHKPARDLTGPALAGARSRWEGQGDIYAWVKNSQAYLKTGNQYANNLFNEWNKSVMTPHDLSNEEIDKVLDFVDLSPWPNFQYLGIDPAKVQAIWHERFNGTNLATREFEERMREIHRTCDNKVLDLYATNLDKNLSQLDSMAVRMGHGAFASFALRNDGRVQLPEHAAERLRKVYTEWSQRYGEAARMAQADYKKREQALDDDVKLKIAKDNKTERNARAKLLKEETDANLRSVYEQLGYSVRQVSNPWSTRNTSGSQASTERTSTPTRRNSPALPSPPRRAFIAPITTLGWKNVDRAVLAASNRQSISVTDGRGPKEAKITYEPFELVLPNSHGYDEVRAYLIPRELNSYQRILAVGDRFRENLNALFIYDVVVLARVGEQLHMGEALRVERHSSLSVNLFTVTAEDLEVKLARFDRSGGSGLADVGSHMQFLTRQEMRSKARKQADAFRKELTAVVFPCIREASTTADPTVTTSAERVIDDVGIEASG